MLYRDSCIELARDNSAVCTNVKSAGRESSFACKVLIYRLLGRKNSEGQVRVCLSLYQQSCVSLVAVHRLL